jgi:predicted  nucleic acid-binding Zn-ribbon protein
LLRAAKLLLSAVEKSRVNSVRHDLVLMIELQQVYDRIAAALTEWNTPPVEVQELHEANRKRQTELEESEAQIAKLEEECRKVHKKEEEWTLELEHFQRQKGLVTNEREFTAVISEIDYASKALDENLTKRKGLETAISDLRDDIEARRAARPDEEAAQKQVVEAWENRRAELKKTIHTNAALTKDIERQLQPKARARFLRLLESKRGTAIAQVVDGSCSLCHFALRPHLQQRVRRVEEIIACEHCHRILYFAEVVTSDEP